MTKLVAQRRKCKLDTRGQWESKIHTDLCMYADSSIQARVPVAGPKWHSTSGTSFEGNAKPKRQSGQLIYNTPAVGSTYGTRIRHTILV